MQRQSLGSPASKRQSHVGEDEDDKKADKLLCPTDKCIHLIPLLTILCFLVLYLVSYDPSQKDLVKIQGFKGLSRPKDPMETGDLERFFEVEKSEVLAIRRHRSLQEVGKGDRKSFPLNLHRKLGEF